MAAVISLAGAARAQTGPDTVGTSPNLMLLLDTSGSMEWKASGNEDPACEPTTPNSASSSPNEKSRWIDVMEVLTGSIENYSCYAQKRNASTNFRNEFRLGPTSRELPYDMGYVARYHRPLSNGCAPGAGDNPWYDGSTGVWSFSAPGKDPIKFRPFVGGDVGLGSTCSTWSQLTDGLLDAFNGNVRFGLMTFDSQTDPGTGILGSSMDADNGLRGTWSYYLTSPSPRSSCQRPDSAGNCPTTQTNGTTESNPAGCCQGTPWDCTVPAPYELGARNAAAPPWEGRMVAFGPPSADGTEQNAWIQQILLATRPYGATPVAAMLNDARDFFWLDASDDPLHAGEKFGPASDPLGGKCRENYIVLVTDGEPNLELRPECVNGTDSSKCPYQPPETITDDLANSTLHTPVRTFVVGFGLPKPGASSSGVGGTDCSQMNLATDCNLTPADPAARACCALNQIAWNGTPTALRGKTGEIDHALFAQNASELRTALSQVFTVLFKRIAGRTYPVTTAATVVTDPSIRGFEFGSGANVMSQGLWRGVLQRRRIICDDQTPPKPKVVDPPDVGKGDDYAARLNADPDNRSLFTVAPDDANGDRFATRSIRPFLENTIDDGAGHYSGTQTPMATPATFADQIQAASLSITGTTCPSLTASACKDRIVKWASGDPSASPVSRCPRPGASDCSVLGDIFHSVPQIRPGIPAEFLRDETYAGFANGLAIGKRDTMLYVSSNDGFFHAFVVTPGDKTLDAEVLSKKNNEKWAFVPPAVLPSFVTMYPFTTSGVMNRIPALDGVPVLKDVVATRGGPRALSGAYPYRLERKKFPEATETHTFRTVVVQSFGSKHGGYFALDVTKPAPSADPTDGVKFLWQLTTDAAGNQLFGSGTPTPLVTTVFVDTGVGTEKVREVPIAVLSGGIGDPPQAGDPTCTAVGTPMADVTVRSVVRCYPDAPGSKSSTAARSLTFVRLDTGEIIRTFRPRNVTQPVTFDTKVLTEIDLPAPIVGQPVAYPGETGQIADRVFVGDAEGRVWRVDVSSTDPSRWTMQIFHDAYFDQNTSTFLPAAQPIQTAPVVSVDNVGQITLAFSTGDQENLAPDAAHVNYVASLTEVLDRSNPASFVFKSQLNWRESLTSGDRVLGPMTLFDKVLYFSTFQQPLTVACDTALESRIWGLNYLLPLDPANPKLGGRAGGTFANPTDRFLTQPGLVSGVGLRQLPSCTASVAPPTTDTDFLGYGAFTTLTPRDPGQFELVFQKSGVTSSGAPKIETQTIPLRTPQTSVNIEDWAPMIE